MAQCKLGRSAMEVTTGRACRQRRAAASAAVVFVIWGHSAGARPAGGGPFAGSYPLLSLVPATSAQARLSGPRPADRGGGGQGEGGMDLGFGDAPVREAGVAGQPPPFFRVLGAHREIGWPGLPGLLPERDELAGLGE